MPNGAGKAIVERWEAGDRTRCPVCGGSYDACPHDGTQAAARVERLKIEMVVEAVLARKEKSAGVTAAVSEVAGVSQDEVVQQLLRENARMLDLLMPFATAAHALAALGKDDRQFLCAHNGLVWTSVGLQVRHCREVAEYLRSRSAAVPGGG